MLIVGLNFSPEPTGVGKYTGEMAQWLAARGHSVTAVSAPPYYPFWKIGDGYRAWRWQRERVGGCQVIRCPLYVPARPSGVKRVAHLASFGAAALPASLIAAARQKPDIVAAIVPTLAAAPAALLAARLAGAKSWIHVQDLEVDAAFEFGILGRAGLGQAGLGHRKARRAALAAERALLNRFDLVTTISEAMRERLAQKGVAAGKLALFPNWVDTDAITPLPPSAARRRAFGLPEDRVIALYSGSMGEKHGLETVIAAARLLGHGKLHFVIAGDGPGKARLEREAAGLRNVTLLPLQRADRLNEFLSIADIHLLPQRPDAAELVMPSKLGAMLASGRPVLAMVHEDSPVARAIGDGGCVTPPGDAEAAAAALIALAEDEARRERLGRAARVAVMVLGRDKLLEKMEVRLARPDRQAARLVLAQ